MMTLSNAPGHWRWEQRGEKWWRIHDKLNIEDGPHDEPHYTVTIGRGDQLWEYTTWNELVDIMVDSLEQTLEGGVDGTLGTTPIDPHPGGVLGTENLGTQDDV